MGAFEDGSSFLAGVLAKVPEDLRAQVKAAFERPEAKDAVVLLGDGVLARSDYSKHMDQLRAQEQRAKEQETALQAKLAEATSLYERNQAWYEANAAALKEYPTLKAALASRRVNGDGDGGDGGDDDRHRTAPPAPLDKAGVEALLDSTLAERERGYVDVVAFLQDTALEHYARFGTKPDMRALVANPKLGKPIAGQPGRVFSLQDAYQEKYGEQVAAKQKEAEDKRIADLVEARLVEERKALAGQPFPLRGGPQPSVLDVIETKEGSAAHTVDSAVALYEQLQAGKGL